MSVTSSNVASGNRFTISDGKRYVLVARNTNASTRTVVFEYVYRGVVVSTTAVTLAVTGAAGAEMAFGPFDISVFGVHVTADAADGDVYVTASGSAGDVKFSVITVPGL
jgi:hypothetical protein